MLVIPTSRIILLKNPIEIDYMNELTFATKTAQYNYFYNLPKLECNNATYQRKDEVVRFPTDPNMEGITYDDLIQYNYCMYQNDKWSNKWFYAFIKNVTFDNPGMSYVELETDVWQSWMFDITFKRSFIEREHVNDDTIGIHTFPENLEIGDPICYGKQEVLSNPNNFKICFAVTETPDEDYDPTLHKNICGIYGGLYYLAVDDYENADNLIKLYDIFNKAEAIISIFMIPNGLTDVLNYSTWTYHSGQSDQIVVKYREVVDGETTTQGTYASEFITAISMDRPTTIGTYTPKNKKLLTYPYIYCNATNNCGTTIPFRYEDSYYTVEGDPTISLMFFIEGCVTPGISAKAIPIKYKGLQENYNYGVMLGKFPVCSWVSDYYLNWMTQNGVNTAVNSALDIIPNAVSASLGNPSGFTGVVSGIINAVHQFRVADLTPNQAKGNVNSGDINFSYMDSGGFSLYDMRIKEEYAKIIDDYFSAYGYAVNSYKLPNINGRTNWNYVKTIGCNIIGDIPQNDLQKIKDMFNAGVTLWHNPSTFLDYSQSNNIVT